MGNRNVIFPSPAALVVGLGRTDGMKPSRVRTANLELKPLPLLRGSDCPLVLARASIANPDASQFDAWTVARLKLIRGSWLSVQEGSHVVSS